MVFSSMTFVPLFLPLVLVLYYATKHAGIRNTVLLVFSLIFYAWGEPKYVLLLMFMAFISWLCALMVARSKRRGFQGFWVGVAAVVDISLIGYFKRKNDVKLYAHIIERFCLWNGTGKSIEDKSARTI